MKREVLRIVLTVVLCTLLAFGACFLCACLMDHVEPLASAETVILPDDGVVGINLFENSHFYKGTEGFTVNNGMTMTVNSDYTMTVVGTASNQRFIRSMPLDQMQSNTTYTLSFCYKLTGYCHTYIWNSTTNSAVVRSNVPTSSEWVVDVIVFHVDELGTLTWRFDGANTQSITFMWYKLEKGNEFTGYVPNYNEIYQDEWDTLYNYNNGWVRYTIFRDYLSDDTNLASLSSSNGGTSTYVSGLGTKLSSSSNGTSFSSTSSSSWSSNTNETHTISIGYIGYFTKGAVTLSLTYDYFDNVSLDYPYDGTDRMTATYSYQLDPDKVFYYTLSCCSAPSVTLTLNANTDFYLQAYKDEVGQYFTRFPVGGISNESSWNNGYFSGYDTGKSDGLTIGYNEGYTSGESVGYQSGYDQGHLIGYSDGLSVADNGSWQSLFSAMLDVPISSITGFLDVEIFGFNFLSLFRTLVLFSLFIYLVRFLVGKYA